MALDRLQGDLQESGATVTRLPGGLRDETGRFICLAHPFQPNRPSSERAAQQAAGRDTVAVDILLILRALPIATDQALSLPKVDDGSALKIADDGVPLISAEDVLGGIDAVSASGPRYDVGEVEPGDFLFRLDANTLGGPKGDGAAAVPKGTLCLFRPHAGEIEPKAIYLLGRNDGHAFGATSAAWTVGHVQASLSDGMRIRYRAAPERIDCPSEVIKPAATVQPIAKFIRAVH